MSSPYAHIRSAVQEGGTDTRVEVNQRALIDKILARYSSPNAVYRELLQNSNDAEAKNAQILFTTSNSDSNNTPVANKSHIVTQVVYRNDGHSFRPEDWSRLRNIAEGNPDVSKVGAFGVGAYTMFSICEQPLIISGDAALSFSWRGDSLWARTGPITDPIASGKFKKWTTFVLPSRDPYVLPDLVPFAQFLCASLSFTASLSTISVFVDAENSDGNSGNSEPQPVLSISKQQVGEPRFVTPPRTRSIFGREAMVTSSPNGIFTLVSNSDAITETVRAFKVKIGDNSHTIHARFMSAFANVRVQPDMLARIQRVTKKRPPQRIPIHIFVKADGANEARAANAAQQVTQSFSPPFGAGKIFIGFRTSQTTGLAAHLAAPLVPTVEREAIDLQDAALKTYNSDLLFIAGTLMRLTLEHGMGAIGTRYDDSASARAAFEEQYQREKREKKKQRTSPQVTSSSSDQSIALQGEDGKKGNHQATIKEETSSSGGGSIFSFVRFMTSGVRNLASAITGLDSGDANESDDEDDLMNPTDARPLSDEERDAIMLMKAFSPQPSTPDPYVGALIARGFMASMPRHTPPVLTSSGVARAVDARLPNRGIEYFVRRNVVRKIVLRNAKPFFEHVAECRQLQIEDLIDHLRAHTLVPDDFVRFIKWWVRFSRTQPDIAISTKSALRNAISFYEDENEAKDVKGEAQTTESENVVKRQRRKLKMTDIMFYRDFELKSHTLPMPPSVLPYAAQNCIPMRVLRDEAIALWLKPIQFVEWAEHAIRHRSLTDGLMEDDSVRLEILSLFSKEHSRRQGADRLKFESWMSDTLGKTKCIPFERFGQDEAVVTDVPSDLYMRDAEIGIFQGLGSFRKVNESVGRAGVSNQMLLALGVRKSISIDFLFTQLNNLKWNNDPRPLIRYLRSATLSAEDINKLKQSQYLPAAQDKSRMFSPGELLLPNEELDLFPVFKKLQWPDVLNERSEDAAFLKVIGCQTDPPLSAVLSYIAANDVAASPTSDRTRFKRLEFVSKRLGPGGAYEKSFPSYSHVKFIPAIRNDPFGIRPTTYEMQSFSSCFSNTGSLCMGFAVLDPDLDTGVGRMFGERFLCAEHPRSDQLISQLIHLASFARRKCELTSEPKSTSSTKESIPKELSNQQIIATFTKIFEYLSVRPVDNIQKLRIQSEPFIPYVSPANGNSTGEPIIWCRPNEVYFQQQSKTSFDETADENEQDDGVSQLFKAIPFNSFLATIGVRSEPSIEDILKMILNSPADIFERVGGEGPYLRLLRRIAVSSFGSNINPKMQRCPFLVGYRSQIEEKMETPGTFAASDKNENDEIMNMKTERMGESKINGGVGQSSKAFLARADEISLVDNTSFARMFSVLTAPQESDLERFYELLGSKYISKQVRKRFRTMAPKFDATELTQSFQARLAERRPLLVSSGMRSSPLHPDAQAILSDSSVHVKQVTGVIAEYQLGSIVKRANVTCGAELSRRPIMRCNIFVTKPIDWFDVGTAIGDVILKRPRLEDAFFLGSILEAPLSQLRAHGFPVDRILKYNNAQQELRQRQQQQQKVTSGPSKLPGETHKEPIQTHRGNVGGSSAESRQPQQSQPKEPGQGEVEDGLEEILKQMFPQCSREYLRQKLGANPSLDRLREIKAELEEKYPRDIQRNVIDAQGESAAPMGTKPAPSQLVTTENNGGVTNRRKKGLFNRVFRNKPSPSQIFSSITPGPPAVSTGSSSDFNDADKGIGTANGISNIHEDPSRRVEPEEDAETHRRLENALHHAAQSSRMVNASGVLWHGGQSAARGGGMSDAENIPLSIVDKAGECDETASHSLSPWQNGTTILGIRIFQTTEDVGSVSFLSSHRDALTAFAVVIRNLCSVCQISTSCAAIFHEPSGRVIAFNQSRALHFNFRFFVALHWRDHQHQVSIPCYTYWLTTMCHELAHNLVSGHGKQHGHVTEMFVSMFMPNLIAQLPRFRLVEATH